METYRDVAQLATIRISCKGEIGTAVLYYPDEPLGYMYVFTAKHCLMGKEFDKEFVTSDIVLDRILNDKDGSWHFYRLTETDIAICSPSNEEDIALLIIPKQRLVELTDRCLSYQIIAPASEIGSCLIRGFASFNDNKDDRPFSTEFVEIKKENERLFILKAEENLETFDESAIENVKGLSGSGVFAKLKDRLYLTGIIHYYEEKNFFLGTSILAYNKLIPLDKYVGLSPVKPELDDTVICTFHTIEKNRESISQRTIDTVATIHIQRDSRDLQNLLNSSRIAVIHGKPGVGKSAMAKNVVAEMRKDRETTVITFTPEQLYTSNITEALSKAGYNASLEQIANSPLSSKRIVIWIESFEKLIESGHEGAFYELLAFVNKHCRLSLLITIRDYLLQKFKITFHFELPAKNIYYQVKEFNEEEISRIKENVPDLIPLFENPKISQLLRNPYYLDKATRILPQLLQASHLDEVSFKRLMWEHIVEAGVKERGNTFLGVALKRAREMSMYTSFESPEANINALLKDNILQVEESELRNRYSPSHDILEDWALVRYIKQQKQEAASPQTFISSLGNSPAIRRAFRLWLDELYRQETNQAIAFGNIILLDKNVSQSWKDELVITILGSDSAHVLFSTLHKELLENDGMLLKRFMRLLETGCKILEDNNDLSNFLPTGSGWDAAISFIRHNWKIVKGFHLFDFTYLSVIESWSKQFPDFNPTILPPAAVDSAHLLLDFLFRLQDKIGHYETGNGNDFFIRKYVAILFKLTSVVLPEIKELIEAAAVVETQKHPKWYSKDFLYYIRDYVKDGVMSDQICKHFPEKVINIALEEWKEKPEDRVSNESMFTSREEVDTDYFGLDRHLKHDTEPPSGYRTFFYWMFLYHPKRAIEFLIPFLNEAFEHNIKVLSKLGRNVPHIKVVFETGISRRYFWRNDYWTMYRESYSRHAIISSLLMALETSLLKLADASNSNYLEVREYLSKLIFETNNVAILAVVTSVIQAHPQLLDKNSVSLLGVPDFFHWDGSRYTSEYLNLSDYGSDPFLRAERMASNKRPHRQKYYMGLVGFVADYMFYHGEVIDLLFKQVDAMWEQAPVEDKIWRKFLFDMDARKYRFVSLETPEHRNLVQVIPDYDADVKEAIGEPKNFRVPKATMVWADKVFKEEEVESQTYEIWKEGYEYIVSPEGQHDILLAPGTMATIGLRDYFYRLTKEEAEWCKTIICEQTKRLLTKRNDLTYDRYATQEEQIIYGLPLLFQLDLEAAFTQDMKRLLFELLLSHLQENSRAQLEASTLRHLWPIQPDFVQNCWCGVLEFIRLSRLANQRTSSYQRFYEDDEDELESIEEGEELSENWREELTTSVLDRTVSTPDISKIVLDSSTGRCLDDALRLMPYNTEIPIHREFAQKILVLLVSFLNEEKRRYSTNFFQNRHVFKFFYARYLLAQPRDEAAKLFKDLLNLTDHTGTIILTEKTREFRYNLIKESISAVNSGSSVENFWHLWTILYEWIMETKQIELFPLLLMDFGWSHESETWFVLEGKKHFYQELIMSYGFNDINASFRLLATAGFRNFMPDSIAWAAQMLNSQNSTKAETELLERFAQKAFYNYGAAIKSDKQLLTDFISILDFLILSRSTKAYMLKEELIQYK